jgi:hypothetical protein
LSEENGTEKGMERWFELQKAVKSFNCFGCAEYFRFLAENAI